jgi:pyruvate formate lyase activating enzyme
MAKCRVCHSESNSIPKELGLCLSCIRERPEEAMPLALETHARCRSAFGLPVTPPEAPQGLACNLCINECRIPEGGLGYCGLRRNEKGKLVGVSAREGKLSWYHDPLPTNCVADWVCPGGTGAGYPEYACSAAAEYGHSNLAVFFHACSMNCLFCQNWEFRKHTVFNRTTKVDRLVDAVDDKTNCICYFGGDPGPQLPFAIEASRLARDGNKGRILRICLETNGNMHRRLLDEMMELVLESGGCVKFDLKAWDENLHIALGGVTNRRTVENFRRAGEMVSRRPVPPVLIASTLLVPGYVDEREVRNIARFIASVHPQIPYSLLGFYPHFFMSDLPRTLAKVAERCASAAREEGLRNVRVGNIHLLV